MRGLTIAIAALLCAGMACKGKSAEERMAERQKALEDARAKEKQAQPAAEAAAEKAPDRPKDPYWDDEDLVVIRHEKACPEGLWALFPGRAPGGDDEKRKENAAKRDEIARALKQKTFVARLHGPQEVTLKEYDAPKGQFPLEMKGVIDCEDSIGRIAIAFTRAKPLTPPPSAATSDAVTQSYWDGPTKTYTVPMKSQTDAKTFRNKHQFGMEGYVVFKLGKTDVHEKKVKIPKVSQGGITIGGSVDDFGAGRLVNADVEAVRVLANPGPVVVIDTRDPSKVSLK